MANNKFQCLSQRNKIKRDQCLNAKDMPEVDIYILDQKGLVDLWLFDKRIKGLNDQQISSLIDGMKLAEFVSTRGSLFHDISAFYRLAEDLYKGGAILSKYEITRNGAQSYITFQGNHRLRSVIKGSRYLLNNAKIMALGIGQAGMKVSAKGGVLLTFIYSVPFRTLELVLQKDYLITNWVVNVSTDVLFASISATLGYIAGVSAATLSGVVLLPIGVGIVVAFLVGEHLNSLEGRLELKQKATAALNEHFEKSAQKAVENLHEDIVKRKAISQLQRSTNGVMFR